MGDGTEVLSIQPRVIKMKAIRAKTVPKLVKPVKYLNLQNISFTTKRKT